MLNDLSKIGTGFTLHSNLFVFQIWPPDLLFPQAHVNHLVLLEIKSSGLDQYLPKLVEHYLSTESVYHLFLSLLKDYQLNIVYKWPKICGWRERKEKHVSHLKTYHLQNKIQSCSVEFSFKLSILLGQIMEIFAKVYLLWIKHLLLLFIT